MKRKILQVGCLAFLAATITILIAGCENPLSKEDEVRPEVLAPETYRDLNRYFSESDYHWNRLDRGVPPLILKKLPEDLHRIPRVSVRKKIFFMSLLPMILLENREIEQKRKRLQEISDRFKSNDSMSPADRQFLENLSGEYELAWEPENLRGSLEKLLLRVDILPPSMVLAQAANESGYGTSRFARLGNNLFGEWTFVRGAGIVPRGRPAGASHEVRRFESVYESLKSYMHNINTHNAYQALREMRHQTRRKGNPIRGLELARGLTLYSSRRADYVREIRSMIRVNDLARLSDASLRSPPSLLLKDLFRESGGGLLSSRRIAAHQSNKLKD